MTIQKIQIINFGSVQFFQNSLNPHLTVIETKYLSEITTAIEMVLCNKVVSSLPNEWIKSDTEIIAEICINDMIYHVFINTDSSPLPTLNLRVTDDSGREMTTQYLSMLSRNLDPDMIESFDGHDKSILLRPDKHLSQTEETLFSYICFLSVAEFCSNIDAIQNQHYAKKPLLIKHFLEYLDEATEMGDLIHRTLALKHQIILVTLPIKKEILNKWIGDQP